jgi:hypothetical protein
MIATAGGTTVVKVTGVRPRGVLHRCRKGNPHTESWKERESRLGLLRRVLNEARAVAKSETGRVRLSWEFRSA